MRHAEYWQQRFTQLEQAQNQIGVDAFREIERQYREAQRQLEGQITRWYQRFADHNEISLAEARRYLQGAELKEFKWDVQDYIRYGRENALTGAWMKELENASARYHISRLEALKMRMQHSLEVLFAKQQGTLHQAMGEAYRSGFYHTAYELQRGFRLGWDVAGIDQAQVEKVLSKPWAADGYNFSERIWRNKNKLIAELHNELSKNILLGADPQKAIDALAKKMHTSKNNAGRLVMTEEAYFSSAAQRDCFRELGVEQYEIVATLDSHTSEICRSLDGKHFPLKDYQPGVTAPPFHVYCRSTTAPYFEEQFDVGERAARGADGKTYYVPGDMTYAEWKKAFVEGEKDGFEEIKKNHFSRTEKHDTIKTREIDVTASTTKLQKVMSDAEYQEYIGRINNHENRSIPALYQEYADGVSAVRYSAGSGYYQPATNEIVFSYPEQRYQDNGRGKYSTLAHEYGHYFDTKAQFDGLSFNELDAIYQNTTYGRSLFKERASSSDAFLTAVRKDRESLAHSLTSAVAKELFQNDGSHGVQDAIDGMLGIRICWGHGDKYYNRKYASLKSVGDHNGLKKAYKTLGFDATNQKKVQWECRIYETASEMWANIMEAEVNGGDALQFVKEYLPNSYAAFVAILEGVK